MRLTIYFVFIRDSIIICHFVVIKYLSCGEMRSCCLLIWSSDLPLIPVKAMADIVDSGINRALCNILKYVYAVEDELGVAKLPIVIW